MPYACSGYSPPFISSKARNLIGFGGVFREILGSSVSNDKGVGPNAEVLMRSIS